MKSSHTYYYTAFFLTVISTVILTNLFLYAEERSAAPLTIVASILPTRTIIVDKTLTIQKVYSNTAEDVRPIVFLDLLDGAELPYSDTVREQYEEIKTYANFSQPGIVYERDVRPVQAFLKRTISFTSSLLTW